MKLLNKTIIGQGAVRSETRITLEVSDEERTKLREALVIIGKAEKTSGATLKRCDWMMAHSYHFNRDGTVSLTVEKGSCG